METPIWGADAPAHGDNFDWTCADAPAHGDPYMGCRCTCSWRPLYGVQICLLMETPIWGADAPAHGDPYMGCRCTCSWRPLYGVQMHLLMETPIWGADAPAHGCNDPYMGADAPGLACLWMHGDNNGDLCIWGVARGFMETPGYGVKMQWMHGEPWVRGEDAVNAWRPLGMGCGCMDTPGYRVKMQWMHGDPWVWGVDAWIPLGTG